MSAWSIDPSKFTKVVEADLGKLRTRISLELMRSVILRTPVDTGRARGSWNLSYDVAIPLSMIRTAGQAISSNTGKLASRANKPYETVVINSSLPYIRKLEKGSSAQAPTGMLRISVASIKAKYR